MNFTEQMQAHLQSLRDARRYRELEIPEGLAFVDNDYLGLSRHPTLIAAGTDALARFGAGSRGSRLLGGQSRLYDETEAKIARFFGAPGARLFSTGYMANLALLGVMSAFVDKLVCDVRIHASLIDGARLTGKSRHIQPHNTWGNLPAALKSERLLFVAESLYSMDGDFLDVEAMTRAMSDTQSFLVLDEAHSAGVFREDGRGLHTSFTDWNRKAVIVTFGKAFGVAGAAILGSRELCDCVVNSARSFIYTTAPAPAVVAMIGESVDVVEREGWRREELSRRAREVRRTLSALPGQEALAALSREPFSAGSPIIPFFLPGEDKALRFCESMRKKGIYLRAIRYPTVPFGAERARISLSLGVSREDTETLTEEVVKTWMAFLS